MLRPTTKPSTKNKNQSRKTRHPRDSEALLVEEPQERRCAVSPAVHRSPPAAVLCKGWMVVKMMCLTVVFHALFLVFVKVYEGFKLAQQTTNVGSSISSESTQLPWAPCFAVDTFQDSSNILKRAIHMLVKTPSTYPW